MKKHTKVASAQDNNCSKREKNIMIFVDAVIMNASYCELSFHKSRVIIHHLRKQENEEFYLQSLFSISFRATKCS
jgi:hypothetical protein